MWCDGLGIISCTLCLMHVGKTQKEGYNPCPRCYANSRVKLSSLLSNSAALASAM